MKLRFFILLAIITVFGVFSAATAQVDSVLGQFTNSNAESFAGGISGNGRFVVFESRGNLATENPRNADNNREIFLFDYAQRRIFQITDTKVLLKNIATAPTFDNVRVEIANVRPVISNDGRWIAFGSNATIAFPGTATLPPIISETNPGNFDANFFTVRTTNPTAETNSLTQDGNLEMWLYQVPAVAPADLTTGEELPVTNLSAGSFTRVTNTPPSVLPAAASTTSGAFIADDNHDASISNDGNVTAFVSTRDLDLVVGNASPQNNDEIFTYLRSANQISQVTNTPRGAVANPIYSVAPSISGGGTRVAFSSNGVNPIVGMTGGSNADLNEEIFYTDLNAIGAPTGTRRQITTTTQTNPGDIVNVWDFGRRMSLDGRYIAFDSYAELEPAGSGASQPAFALYLYDTAAATNPFRRIGPKSDADSAAGGGDVAHYPGFTDYSISGAPATLVFSTRLNIKADGTIPATQADGLNPEAARPVQIYSYPLNQPAATATFTRLTKFPTPNSFLASTQAIPSDSVQRITFNLALTEPGTGNPDLLSEVFYLLQPVAATQTTLASLNLATGASRIPVSPSPVPTPSPTATPSPTPTPSPSATPIPTPTPQTPSAVQGLSPGMLAVVNFNPALSPAIVARTAVGSLSRSFTLPIQLSGVTLTVNGVAAGLKSVSSTQIEFVVPPALTGSAAGTAYPVVINNNGTVIKGTTAIPLNIILVPARPDVFTNLPVPGPGGRARVFNATNTVLTTEPFTVTTVRRRGGRRVPTVLRLHLTGVQGLPAAAFTIRIGSTTITGAQITSGAVLFAPGVYTVDFTLPPELNRAGDQPIIVSVTVGGVTYFARLDDTAPRLFIL